jgi:D-hydroxyproline dehydrogenase subunit alpha
MVTAAHGDDRLRSVTSARITQDGRVAPGSQRTHEVSVLAVSCGFTPRLELHAAAGCTLRQDAQGDVIAKVDDDQFTSCPAVLSAGEPNGIGGASLALVEGQIAGMTAARSLGRSGDGRQARELAALRRRRRRLRAFAAAMASVYTVPGAWPALLTDDTIICRCEEVTYAEIKHALDLGAGDARTVKLLSRAGMGWCQGRICGYPVSCVISRSHDGAADLAGLKIPIAAPLPLSVLAAAEQPAARPVT